MVVSIQRRLKVYNKDKIFKKYSSCSTNRHNCYFEHFFIILKIKK